MSSRPLVILGVIIILIAVIAGAGYVMHTDSAAPAAHSTSTPSNTEYGISPATSTPMASTTWQSIPLPAATTTVNTTSWPIQVDAQEGYSIEYPQNFVPSVNEGVFVLIVPKTYFHWPLQDDVKITVSASTSCPDIIGGGSKSAAATYTLNGHAFTRRIGTDAGAGNRYVEIADDTKSKGICYHVSLLDHGTNGAGFYVDDRALAAKYDAQHDADFSAVLSLFNAMISSLRILALPQ